MMRLPIRRMMMMGGQKVSLVPFSDNFTRGNGAIGNGWAGGTWTIVGNKAINTPTVSTEKVTDGGLETWDSPTNLHDWTEVVSGTSTINQETTVVKGGSNAARFDLDASGNLLTLSQVLSTTAGLFYFLTYWARGSVAGTTVVAQWAGAASVYNALSTDYVQYRETWQAGAATSQLLFKNSVGTSKSIYLDDISVLVITQASLFAIRNTGIVGQDVTGTYTAIFPRAPMGVLANVNAGGTAGIAAFLTGGSSNSLTMAKWINGAWTTLVAPTAVTLAGGKLPEIKTARSGANLLVDLFYNGAQVGTQQTVTDAEIINNTYAGIISSDNRNTFASFAVSANP